MRVGTFEGWASLGGNFSTPHLNASEQMTTTKEAASTWWPDPVQGKETRILRGKQNEALQCNQVETAAPAAKQQGKLTLARVFIFCLFLPSIKRFQFESDD